jgi:predicted enzyme related to lactoylglutathione lyase
MDRAKTFYEAVLQHKLERLPGTDLEMFAFPMDSGAAGATGALVRMPGARSGGNSTIVYFVTHDCALPAARAAQSGGKIFKGKFSIGQYGFIAHVIDTEGNIFGVHSMK